MDNLGPLGLQHSCSYLKLDKTIRQKIRARRDLDLIKYVCTPVALASTCVLIVQTISDKAKVEGRLQMQIADSSKEVKQELSTKLDKLVKDVAKSNKKSSCCEVEWETAFGSSSLKQILPSH